MVYIRKKFGYIIVFVMIRHKSHLVLTAILLGYTLLLLRFFDLVTIWDAQSNVGLAIEAAKKPFNLFNLEQSSHPNQAYFLPQSLLQRLDPGNMFFIHSVDVFFGILMICAFFGILCSVTPDKKNRIDVYLMTFLFAFYPIFTANVLYASYDFALTSYIALTLYFLLKKRYFLAALFGLGQLFSKEPGIAIYAVTLVLYALFIAKNKRHTKVNTAVIKTVTILFIPYMILFFYFLYKTFVFKSNVFFSTRMPVFMNATSYTFLWPTWDISRVRFSYLVTIFILNFNWILTLVVILGLVKILWFFIRKKINSLEIDIRTSLFITALFIPVTLVLSYVKIFTNPRYFMPSYFLLLLIFYMAILLIPRVIIRRVLLFGITALMFISNFETIDPVSKKLYGTFSFGDHTMLKMSSLTGECCGYGRDQLVYNLQYIYIERLTDEIFRFYRIDKNSAIATDKVVGNIFSLGVDKTTYRRSWRSDQVVFPSDISWDFFVPSFPRPSTVYYIDYPFRGPTDTFSRYLSYYKIKDTRIFDIDGYKLPVYVLVR